MAQLNCSPLSCWRCLFKYDWNREFATACEIAFRGGVLLTLFATPRVLKANTGGVANSVVDTGGVDFFYTMHLHNSMFKSGALMSCVFSLGPSLGVTLRNTTHSMARLLMAALVSWLMYLPFDKGCRGTEPMWHISLCHLFGGGTQCDNVTSTTATTTTTAIAFPEDDSCFYFGAGVGAVAIVMCLLLNLPGRFQLFFCSNFVCFWMAFLNPYQCEKRKADVVVAYGDCPVPNT